MEGQDDLYFTLHYFVLNPEGFLRSTDFAYILKSISCINTILSYYKSVWLELT